MPRAYSRTIKYTIGRLCHYPLHINTLPLHHPNFHHFTTIFFTTKFGYIFFLSYICTRKQGDSVAQLVEHNTFNVGVLGSSPSWITKKAYRCTPFLLFVRKPGHLRRSGTVRTYSIKRKNSILGTPNVPISERFFLLRNKPLVKRAKCIRLYSIKIVCYEA